MNQPEDEILWAYLDGILRPREHAILTKRLLEEAPLQQRLDELRQMHRLLLESLPTIDVSESVVRVVDQVSNQLDAKPDKDTQS